MNWKTYFEAVREVREEYEAGLISFLVAALLGTVLAVTVFVELHPSQLRTLLEW